MAISHNREIQSSSTTASNFVPTCESIDQLTCPSPDEGKHAQRHIAIGWPNARRGPRKAAVLLPAQGLANAPHPFAGAAQSGDFGVGC